MDSDQFRDAAHAAIEDVISYFQSLPNLRVVPSIQPGYLRPQLPSTPPQTPQPAKSILSDIKTYIMPGLTHWQSPKFMAWFPACTTYPSILGEIFSAAFTAPAFNWLCSPACTELETIVLDWMAGMLGLPECFLSTGSTSGGGVIQGSASEAIVSVMFAAREQAVRAALEREGLSEQPDEPASRSQAREDRAAEIRAKLVALGSSQAHSATQKAANILGVRYRAVHATAATGFVMTAAALQAKLDECTAASLQPFYVTATLGTTATCAVDDLPGIAALKHTWERQGGVLWAHIDAAYAGGILLCEEFRAGAHADQLSAFDSFDVNMHKWLMVNFDASLLYLRDRRPLTAAMSITRSYLLSPPSIAGLVTDYRDWQIPLGRRFRALKIWFVVRTFGVEGLQALVRKHVGLGEYFAGLVRGRPDLFEVVAGPTFALTVMRCVAGGGGGRGVDGGKFEEAGINGEKEKEEEKNQLTREVCALVNARGEVFVTGATVEDVYAIRVVSANEQAEEKYVARAFEVLVEATEEVRAAKNVGVNGTGQ